MEGMTPPQIVYV